MLQFADLTGTSSRRRYRPVQHVYRIGPNRRVPVKLSSIRWTHQSEMSASPSYNGVIADVGSMIIITACNIYALSRCPYFA